VRKAIEDCGSDDLATRKPGRQALPRLLDQALGRVEEAMGSLSTEDTDLNEIPREERAAMIAELRRQLAEREDEEQDIEARGGSEDESAGM
jgi:hypothetical protein